MNRHEFEPGGVYPELCVARLAVENGVVFCGLHIEDASHGGISNRAAVALADVAALRTAIGPWTVPDRDDRIRFRQHLDRIEQALRGGA